MSKVVIEFILTGVNCPGLYEEVEGEGWVELMAGWGWFWLLCDSICIKGDGWKWNVATEQQHTAIAVSSNIEFKGDFIILLLGVVFYAAPNKDRVVGRATEFDGIAWHSHKT